MQWARPRRTLFVHLDRASDNFYNKIAFFTALNGRGWFFSDGAHDLHNVFLDGLEEAGIKHVRQEMNLIAGIGNGPWKLQGHYQTFKGALKEYTDNYDETDELFQFMYPLVARLSHQNKQPLDW